MTEGNLIPLKDAAEILGVSKMTMARLVKDGRLTIYRSPIDKRLKLVSREEVANVAKPYREDPDEKKAAA
jgi:excisionase family DNA binding protein